MKCYYHRVDLDGICSAAIVKQKFPSCELIGANYGDNIIPDCEKGETVYVVDFSFNAEQMELLHQQGNLIWLDHHITAIEDLPGEYAGKREVDKAGCELTWEYLHPNMVMPDVVHLLGRYDVWDHVPGAVELNLSISANGFRPDDSVWETLLGPNPPIESLLTIGNEIRRYKRFTNDRVVKTSWVAMWEGYTCRFANGFMDRTLMDEILEDCHVNFYFKPNVGWVVSLRSDTIDVSVIAKKYGGGGHCGAAGFTIPELPFEL